MIETGSYNNLTVESKSEEGLILTDGEERVILPYLQMPKNTKPGDEIFVFVYHNKEGGLFATTKRPFACAGDFALLKVVEETDKGAFMDIGIDKDIFVPLREQKQPMKRGQEYVVYVYIDKFNGRITASSYLEEFTDTDLSDLEEGEEVSLLISDYSPLGYSAVVNNRYIGLLYHNELYEELEIGEYRQGYIKKIRENNKVDLSLRPIGFDFILESKDVILEILKENGGILNLGDKSSPDEIRQYLKMSKKAFKQVIGGLYKERLITISDHQIKLVSKTEEQ